VHTLADVALLALEYVPTGHAVQADAADAAEYEPLGHAAHTAADVAPDVAEK